MDKTIENGMGVVEDTEINSPFLNMDSEDLLETDIEIDDDTVIDDDAPATRDDDETDDDTPEIYADEDDDGDDAEHGGFVDAKADAEDDDPNSDWARQQRIVERQIKERIDSEMQSFAREMQAEIGRNEAEQARAEAVLANVEGKQAEAQRELERAIDDEDTAAQLRYTQLLQDLQKTKADVEDFRHNKLPTSEDIQQAFERQAAIRQQEILSSHNTSNMPKAQTPTAARWQSRNQWMADPKYAAETKDLIEINNKLVADGWDATADSFYTRLGQELKAKHPHLPLRDKSGQPFDGKASHKRPLKNKPSGPPVASARRVASTRTSEMRKNKNGNLVVRVTAAEKAMLRAMNKDPSDKEFMRHFAIEKSERLKQEAAMRRGRS